MEYGRHSGLHGVLMIDGLDALHTATIGHGVAFCYSPWRGGSTSWTEKPLRFLPGVDHGGRHFGLLRRLYGRVSGTFGMMVPDDGLAVFRMITGWHFGLQFETSWALWAPIAWMAQGPSPGVRLI